MPLTDRQLKWLKNRLNKMKEELRNRIIKEMKADKKRRTEGDEDGEAKNMNKLDLDKAEDEIKWINRTLKRLEGGAYERDMDKKEKIKVQRLNRSSRSSPTRGKRLRGHDGSRDEE